jgi:hypothetical protein
MAITWMLRRLLDDTLDTEAEYFFGKGELGLNATVYSM